MSDGKMASYDSDVTARTGGAAMRRVARERHEEGRGEQTRRDDEAERERERWINRDASKRGKVRWKRKG